jgi:hypothetical protein
MAGSSPAPVTTYATYDSDFFVWTQEQAALLRAGKFTEIDLQNLAEEIESLGRRDRRELRCRLRSLIAELLKWEAQAGARCGNWRSDILQQRYEIELVLRDSPSLRGWDSHVLQEIYDGARDRVIRELQLFDSAFPADCPYTPEQILSEDFLLE